PSESSTGVAQYGIFNNHATLANTGTFTSPNGTLTNAGTINTSWRRGTVEIGCAAVYTNTGTVSGPPVTLRCARWDGGAGDGLWSSPANWSGDALPGSTTEVVIENTADTVRLDVDFSLTGGGSLTLRGFGATAPTLVVDAGRTLTFDNPGQIRNTVNGHAKVRNDGTIHVNTEFRAQSGTFTNNGTLNVGSASTFATFHTQGGPNTILTNNGTINQDGTLFVSGIVANNGVHNLRRGTIQLFGGINVATFDNASGATLTAQAGTTITVGDPNFVFPDTFRNAGTVTSAGTLVVHRLVTNSGTFSAGATQVTCGGNVRNTGTISYGTLTEACKLWDGDAGDGKWSTPANWSMNTLPAAAHSVRIDGSSLATDVLVDVDVTLAAGRTLEHIGDVRTSNRVNRLTIPTGTTLTIDGTLKVNQADIVNNGTLANRGTTEFFGHPNYDKAQFDNHGTVTNSGTFRLQGSPSESSTGVAQYGIFNNHATLANTGTFTSPNGTLTNAGTIN
ncbi:MAG: hypothetical protein LC708_00750, partial [Actinobacteria bacterium]|nr:hypothetical protein [Actinomycetota bacterium]